MPSRTIKKDIELRIEKASIGTRVFFGKDHIKTIPWKFTKVVRKKHIINPTRKRLTKEERFRLEVAAFEMKLKKTEPLVYGLIKRSIPDFVRKVNTAENIGYYELVYRNKKSVKVNYDVYWLCPDKRSIKRNY